MPNLQSWSLHANLGFLLVYTLHPMLCYMFNIIWVPFAKITFKEIDHISITDIFLSFTVKKDSG
jgi:hypothetical protein